ncbi:MAG: hypothetical protein Fur0039_14590 [Rhodocyclaceae bacterium]
MESQSYTKAEDPASRAVGGRGVRRGMVYLVGAGPGDPELLTLRAAGILGRAEALVYDHLVGAGVLDFVSPHAQRIYVGKEPGHHTLPQSEINAVLVRLARQGKITVRLKGGDPFIFGRGGEEIEELARCHIPFEVVPGITAAAGMAAYAGIPLTHRELAGSCMFVTGHLKEGGCELDWPAAARPRQTVVIYMGVSAIGQIARELIAHGRSAHTPAALVREATGPGQLTITGTLATLPELAARHGITPPALIVIGEVVRLRERLSWFR